MRGPIQPSRIVAFQKLPNFSDTEEVQLRFRPPIKAKYTYEIFARCDSYVGCDVVSSFKIDVQKPKPAEEEKKEEVEEGLEDDPLDEEEKPAVAKWYYMYCTSLFEMVANIVVLLILLFVLINFLQQRGYWQKYVQPSVDQLHGLWLPIWRKLHPILSPIYDPVTRYASSWFTYISESLNRPINITKKVHDDEF